MELLQDFKIELRPDDTAIIRKMKIEFILSDDIQEKRALNLAIINEKTKGK